MECQDDDEWQVDEVSATGTTQQMTPNTARHHISQIAAVPCLGLLNKTWFVQVHGFRVVCCTGSVSCNVHVYHKHTKITRNECCYRPRFCTVRLYWAGDN